MFYANLIGGIIGGLVGFFSAWGILKLEEWRKNRNEPKEMLDKLFLELSKNWFSLSMDIKEGNTGLHELSAQYWNVEVVSKINIEDTNLVGGLELLYKEIALFNALCRDCKIQKLYSLKTTSALDEIKADDSAKAKDLAGRIRQMKALVFAELVKIKKRKASEWKDKNQKEEGFDWRKAINPYIMC